ncbi:MAG: hypothetical protein RID53_27900 [Coleofasciculus sp. B1-GNL1-01]|uniref:hypothetical protein n=1 Tax=Coleofasciculus sp. B1-GNL1-01 TaxID=3068484 RepID=UPI003301D480
MSACILDSLSNPITLNSSKYSPDGIYRVGSLARLNICDRMGTEVADRELQEFRDRAGGVATSSFFYHLHGAMIGAIAYLTTELDISPS